MPLIDDRGRVFGTLNLIDALGAAFLLVLMPLSYGALVLFRTPMPTITSVEPNSIVQHGTIVITGHDFRPYLYVRLGDFETNGGVTNDNPGRLEFIFHSSTLAEVKVPDLPPGKYELALYDEARELARKPNALTVLPPPIEGAPRTAIVVVRFYTAPEMVKLVHVGDVDREASMTSHPEGAVITAINSDPKMTSGVTRFSNYEAAQTVATFEVTFRVPIVDMPAGWSYKDRRVKVGAAFTFENDNGVFSGAILQATIEGQR